jgi:hypothetical protein
MQFVSPRHVVESKTFVKGQLGETRVLPRLIDKSGASIWNSAITQPNVCSTSGEYAAIFWRESHTVKLVNWFSLFSFWMSSFSKQRFVKGQMGGSPVLSSGTM